MPGGGRDWSIDTECQIITSKYHPNLALGSLREDPLILTHRYSYDNPYDNDNDGYDFNLVKFSKKDLENLRNGGNVPMKSMMLALQFPNHINTLSHWDRMLTGVTGTGVSRAVYKGTHVHASDLMLEYVYDNFLVLDGEWALDVSFWKM